MFGNWLITSRSSKRDDEKNNRKSLIYERRYLGSKGIGRLAAMALGRYLTIITKQKKDSKYNWLRIDRDIFKVEDLLNDITFSGGQIENFIELFTDKDFLKENKQVKNENLLLLLTCDDFIRFDEGTMIVIQDVDSSIITMIEEEINYKELNETSIYKSLIDLITPLKLNGKIQAELIKEGIIDTEQRVSNGSDTFELFYGFNLLDPTIKNEIPSDLLIARV